MTDRATRNTEPVPPLQRLDEDALFNPAYVATLIATAAGAHRRAVHARLPLEIAFLVPLLTLPAAVRRELPGNAKAYLSTWLDRHPAVRPALLRLAPAHAPSTRRALRFGIAHDLFDIDAQGVAAGPGLRSVTAQASSDVAEILAAAALVGRWLPRTGPPAAVYNAFGLRP